MKRKTQFVVLLLSLCCFSNAQDSLSMKKKIERPHEIGVSVSSVFFMLAGVSDYSERYTNLTYRRFFRQRQSFKVFTGINIFNANNSYEQTAISSVNTTTLYSIKENDTPSNFQFGLGYEYILGNGKLKHVMGLDVVYNNKFAREKFYYESVTEGNSPASFSRTKLDSGAYTKTNNYDKFGINLNYSLRYSLSKRWVITAGMLVSYRTYKRRENSGHSTVSETNFNGLISDISLFYRF